ncbi:MAG TPA: NAD(P)-dependent oxidoreductase [Myxococcota bacterium]|jgi:dihydroflavonol-4-reductase
MQLEGATIAVTGATGFLGRYLVDTLLRRGARVVGVVRNPDRVPELRERGVELRRADLAEPDRLMAGFRGVDAVVSNAALLSLRTQRWSDYVQTNVDGTVNVCEAAAAAGVRRIVYVSSVSVYRGRRQHVVDEDHVQWASDVRPGRLNAYPLSKALAEQAALRIAQAQRLDLTILRPGGIYGAFDGNFMPIFRAFLRPKLTLYPAWFRLPLVYAGDVAEALALALEKPGSIGRAYNIAGEDRSAWDFARAWKAAGGHFPWLMLPVPFPYRRVYDTARALEELGWRARPYLDGLRETLAFERQGLARNRPVTGSSARPGD